MEKTMLPLLPQHKHTRVRVTAVCDPISITLTSQSQLDFFHAVLSKLQMKPNTFISIQNDKSHCRASRMIQPPTSRTPYKAKDSTLRLSSRLEIQIQPGAEGEAEAERGTWGLCWCM